MDFPRVGVAAMIIKDGRILLIRRKGSHGEGSWATPGGHLEFGETPEVCAIRETREEVGIEITNVRFIAVTNDIFEESGKHYITLWMQADLLSGEPKIAAEDEVAEFGWFNWDCLPSPRFIPFENLLNQNCYPRNGFLNLMKK